MSDLKRETSRDHDRVIDPAEAEGSENNPAQERGHQKGQGKGKGKGRRVMFEESFPIQEVYRGDSEERESHMNVRSGWAGAGLQRGEGSCWSRACGNVVGSGLRETWS